MRSVLTVAVLGVVMLVAVPGWAEGISGELRVEYVSGELSDGSGYSPPDNYVPPVDPGSPGLPPSVSETGTESDYDGWAVSGRVYLDELDTSRGPLELAPFLSRASHVGGSFATLETDDGVIENETWEVFTRLVSDRGWLLEAHFGGSDTEIGVSDDEADLYRLAVGYYVAQDTQLRLAFDALDADGLDEERFAFDVVHVQMLDNGMTWSATALVGLVSGDDDGTDAELSTSLYFNERFGIGANWYKHSRDELQDGDGYALWANYFLNDKWSLNLSFIDEEQSGLENEALTFEVKYRR